MDFVRLVVAYINLRNKCITYMDDECFIFSECCSSASFEILSDVTSKLMSVRDKQPEIYFENLFEMGFNGR